MCKTKTYQMNRLLIIITFNGVVTFKANILMNARPYKGKGGDDERTNQKGAEGT